MRGILTRLGFEPSPDELPVGAWRSPPLARGEASAMLLAILDEPTFARASVFVCFRDFDELHEDPAGYARAVLAEAPEPALVSYDIVDEHFADPVLLEVLARLGVDAPRAAIDARDLEPWHRDLLAGAQPRAPRPAAVGGTGLRARIAAMSMRDLEDLVGSSRFAKGRVLENRKTVRDLVIEGSRASCRIDAPRPGRPEIALSADGALILRCDCPAATGEWKCAHMAALLLAVRAQSPAGLPSPFGGEPRWIPRSGEGMSDLEWPLGPADDGPWRVVVVDAAPAIGPLLLGWRWSVEHAAAWRPIFERWGEELAWRPVVCGSDRLRAYAGRPPRELAALRRVVAEQLALCEDLELPGALTNALGHSWYMWWD